MNQTCVQCSAQFEVTDDDLKFYEQISPEFGGKKYQIPPPRRCPKCREQKQLAWCNELHLYHNTCSLTKKPVISNFHASNPRPVWNIWDWWSDTFNALDYGREIDWDRSILEQIHQLETEVPHACVNTDLENENSEYTHYAGHEKNCYLMFHTSYTEDCLYGYGVKKCKSCCDNYYCHESELCYECIDVKNCYALKWSQECQNCSTCNFVRDCIGCQECTLCAGLRNCKFCFLNEQLTEEEYRKRIADINFASHNVIQSLKVQFRELQLAHTYKHLKNELAENCLGDHLTNAKDSQYCFDASELEGCKYCSQLQLGSRFCYDIYQFGIGIELCYDSAQIGYNVYNCHFCFELLESSHDLLYCIACFASKHCFGCYGLRHHQYCIFNKQYTKEEYEEIVPKLIERMSANDEWGEFFPIKFSPSAYNETMAHLWNPLSKEEVLKNGWTWFDQTEEESYLGPKIELPDSMQDVDDDICENILICEQSGKPYKVIPQELAFYRQVGVPLPRMSFLERHKARFKKRNPRHLWDRTCAKCGSEMKTTFAPERPEIVYCEKCYLDTIH